MSGRQAERDALVAAADRRLEANWHEAQCACSPGLDSCLSGLANKAPITWTTDAVLGAVWDLITPPEEAS